MQTPPPWQKNNVHYLDYMASTPVDPAVQRAIAKHQQQFPGNPSSNHVFGHRAKAQIDHAREQLAALIQTTPESIIWTSGATESINLALQGAIAAYPQTHQHIISFKTEHKATLKTLAALAKQGVAVTLLDVQADGLIDLKMLEAAIQPDTTLISVCHVNNEIGVIQPIEHIAKLAQQHGCLLHVDGAQSLGKANIECLNWGIDYLSLSGHKAYAPPGIGALIVKQSPMRQLKPLLHGGQQQHARSGTLPAGMIVGMGMAAELIKNEKDVTQSNMHRWQTQWLDMFAALGGVTLHGCMTHRVPHNLNIHVAGIDAESLLFSLDHLALSTGSACNHANPEPSHVIQALGHTRQHAQHAIRISLGRYCNDAMIERCCADFYHAIIQLRALSPLDHKGKP